MSEDLTITNRIAIPMAEISLSYIRASGPGGQNVNKVESAAQLRFDAANSPSLPDAVRRRLVELAGARATKAGVIVLTADRHRTQPMNRQNALERLAALVRKATYVAPKRRATKPTLASKRRRMDAKTRRGAVKALRKNKPTMD